MKDEYDVLLRNNIWTLTAFPSNRRAIGYKWVFRTKQNPDGCILKYKACLVAKGFHQQQGFDFTETFSPMFKPITVRFVLTIAIFRHWHITHLDVNNAFFNGILQEEVYMKQLPGFVSYDKHLVCKLNKAMYGLKHAPRALFDRLNSTLHNFGFVSSKCDPFLLHLHSTHPHYIHACVR